MRLILMILIFLISTASYEREIDRSVIIDRTIRNASPRLNRAFSRQLAVSIFKASQKWHIDWRMMVGILQQESSFRANPQGCFTSLKNKCTDFGIAQINFTTWGKVLNLNKKRLVSDIGYNIDIMGQILSLARKGHEHDRNWFTYYHSYTPYYRNNYRTCVFPKIVSAQAFSSKNYYK